MGRMLYLFTRFRMYPNRFTIIGKMISLLVIERAANITHKFIVPRIPNRNHLNALLG
jgi:hypothetical protein